MTTAVLVQAAHGWPVLVSKVTRDGECMESVIVPEDEERLFHVHDGMDIRVHEIQPKETLSREASESGIHPAPDEFSDEEIAKDAILRFFHYSHLPDRLQVRSRPFCAMARRLVDQTPRSAERSVALRKLLEAKDAAVRAAL